MCRADQITLAARAEGVVDVTARRTGRGLLTDVLDRDMQGDRLCGRVPRRVAAHDVERWCTWQRRADEHLVGITRRIREGRVRRAGQLRIADPKSLERLPRHQRDTAELHRVGGDGLPRRRGIVGDREIRTPLPVDRHLEEVEQRAVLAWYDRIVEAEVAQGAVLADVADVDDWR